MSQQWLEIRLQIRPEAVDLASQILVELGSTGVTVADVHLDTFILPEPDLLVSDPQIKAYFPGSATTNELFQTIAEQFARYPGILPALTDCHPGHRLLDAEDWASDWMQHFPPFKVGSQLIIRPSWIDIDPATTERILTLDPGQAFGTGTHATTSLCLDAIAALSESASPPKTVLDVGTGSGILAMAAAALGAKRVIGCDIDSEACRVARDNIALNDLAGQVVISDSLLAEIPGTFDLVLANILAAENIRLSQELINHLQPGGTLVLSGILIEQEDHVVEAFLKHPVELETRLYREEWTCLVYRHHE